MPAIRAHCTFVVQDEGSSLVEYTGSSAVCAAAQCTLKECCREDTSADKEAAAALARKARL